MTYAIIALAIGLAIALYFMRYEKMRRTKAERKVAAAMNLTEQYMKPHNT